MHTVEWGEASGKAGQDLALARPGSVKRRETVKCHPADKKQLSYVKLLKIAAFH